MSITHGLKFPKTNNLIHMIDSYNPKCTTGSGTINDSIKGISWTRSNVNDVIIDNVKAFDMSTTGYITTSDAVTFQQYYTTFYLWKPRSDATSWKTLHRNNNDHVTLILESDKVSLGMYSNRNGAFRDSGYDITNGIWQTLIVTGEGETSESSVGTSTFYINGENVATADRVACGTYLYMVGYFGQSPGYISICGVYNRKLSVSEIHSLHNMLMERL